MPRRNKIVWLALAPLLAFVAVVGALCFKASHTQPQILTLPDGTRYRFAGVTYGTNNIPPSFPARLVSWLPTRLAGIARQALGSRVSQVDAGEKIDQPMLFVWFERLGTNSPGGAVFIQGILADENGVAKGPSDRPLYFVSPFTWSCASFRHIPRRSKTLQLNLYPTGASSGNGGSLPFSVVHITFPNPLYGQFPQWQPEPVPITKSNAFFTVRLDQFDLYNFSATLHAPRGIRSDWTLARTELSDATGNVFEHIHSSPVSANYRDASTEPTGWFTFSGPTGLTPWPGETAWRLKLVYQRDSGFDANELVTFKNVPVPKIGTTNTLNLTQSAGGIQLVLTEFARRPDMVSQGTIFGGVTAQLSQIGIELPGHPADVTLDLLEAATDAGRSYTMFTAQLERSAKFNFSSIPANAKTMDLTFVLQKTRAIEFLVKPPALKPAVTNEPPP